MAWRIASSRPLWSRIWTDAPSSRGSPGVRRCLTLIVTNCQIWPTLVWTRPRGRGPALGGPGCCNFAFSTTRAPVRLFLPSKLSHPLIYEWVGPNRGAEGVKHTLSSLGSAPQAQEGPTPRPRMRPRCSHSEADRTACSQAVRPAVAFACGIRSSRWLRCFSQSPVARGRRAR